MLVIAASGMRVTFRPSDNEFVTTGLPSMCSCLCRRTHGETNRRRVSQGAGRSMMVTVRFRWLPCCSRSVKCCSRTMQ